MKYRILTNQLLPSGDYNTSNGLLKSETVWVIITKVRENTKCLSKYRGLNKRTILNKPIEITNHSCTYYELFKNSQNNCINIELVSGDLLGIKYFECNNVDVQLVELIK